MFEDVLLGANIDTARGLIEEKDARSAGHPFGDNDFLLISAAQAAGQLARGIAFDAEAQLVVFCDTEFLGFVEHAPAGVTSEIGQGDVVRNREFESEAVTLAILGNERDAG